MQPNGRLAFAREFRHLLRCTALQCLGPCLLTLKRAHPAPWEQGWVSSGGPSVQDETVRLRCRTTTSLPGREASLKWVRDGLARRKSALFEAVTLAPGVARALTLATGFEVSSFLALDHIPALSRAGHWAEAADECASFVRLLHARLLRERHPQGAGVMRLPLLTVPSLWALVSAYPDPRDESDLRTARTEWHAGGQVAVDLFTALGQLRLLPAAVCFPAGALAALTCPPGGRAWLERALRAAQAKGAWRFARLFGDIVEQADSSHSMDFCGDT